MIGACSPFCRAVLFKNDWKLQNDVYSRRDGGKSDTSGLGWQGGGDRGSKSGTGLDHRGYMVDSNEGPVTAIRGRWIQGNLGCCRERKRKTGRLPNNQGWGVPLSVLQGR